MDSGENAVHTSALVLVWFSRHRMGGYMGFGPGTREQLPRLAGSADKGVSLTMSIPDLLHSWGILTLSAYAAVLSTLIAIVQWSRDRGRFALNPQTIHIQMWFGSATSRIVEVVNVGRRPLHLEDFGLELTNGQTVSLCTHDTQFPLKLEEGQKHSSYALEKKYQSKVVRTLWARDTTGKEYKSTRFPFGKGDP